MTAGARWAEIRRGIALGLQLWPEFLLLSAITTLLAIGDTGAWSLLAWPVLMLLVALVGVWRLARRDRLAQERDDEEEVQQT